jgi:hypothetical protein
MPRDAVRLVMLKLVPEIPPENVLVAVPVESMEPPVRVKPLVAPRLVVSMPPLKVDVAVEVLSILP